MHLLNILLQHSKCWKWSEECSQAFQQAKQALSSASVLVHCDPTLPLTLAGDASAYGIGAVFSHILPDGSEGPMAFASCSLSASERNYAQLEKEALSLVLGVKKFHRTSTVASLISSPTTNHFLQFWDQRKVYHLWPLPSYSIGPYFSLRTNMRYSLGVHKHTQMLMVCLIPCKICGQAILKGASIGDDVRKLSSRQSHERHRANTKQNMPL